ncbi:MAG: hypothetical protein J6K00_00080 [Oscillospiraceae bacterium]|nr:hypothetical protein [Oscillospiraceae bacterium]
MIISLEAKEKALLEFLTTIPPNMDAAERFLRTTVLTASEVTRVAIVYADECFCEAGDLAMENNEPHSAEIVPDLHSTYIYDVMKLLLQFGLEPNGIYEECNIMDSLKYVDNEFLAADTLALLLEHGGDPSLFVDVEPFFQALDFDVFFDAIEQYDRQRYASLVHCWMVAIGYGARCGAGKMQSFKEYESPEFFDFQKLRSHRNYYFGLSHVDKDFALSIYDKDTLWEVARIV